MLFASEFLFLLLEQVVLALCCGLSLAWLRGRCLHVVLQYFLIRGCIHLAINLNCFFS